MPKLQDVIKALAIKAGVKADDARLTGIDKPDFELDNELVTQITTNLLNVSEAQQHTAVVGAIKAQTLSGIDKTLASSLLEAGITLPSDLLPSDLTTGSKLNKVLSHLGKNLKELESKTVNTAKETEAIAELKKQITDLQRVGNEWQTKYSQAATEHQAQLVKMQQDFVYEQLMANLAAKATLLPEPVRALSFKALFGNHLAQKGGKMVFDTATNSYKIQNNDGLALMNGVKPYAIEDLANEVIDANNLAKRQEPSPTPSPTPFPNPNPNPQFKPVNPGAMVN